MSHGLANIPSSARGIASSSNGQKTSLLEPSRLPIRVLHRVFLVEVLESWGHVVPSPYTV